MAPPPPPPGGAQYRFTSSRRQQQAPVEEAAYEEEHADEEIEYTGGRDGGQAAPILMGVGGVALWFIYHPLALAVWVGTSVWAVISVARLRFSRYNLSGVSGLPSVIIGCFGLWCIAFPWFWINRDRIRSKAALPRGPNDGTRLGTVLLVLASLFCGVIATIGLVAMLLLPSLWQFGLQANEKEVIRALRDYGSAQEVFLRDGYASVPGNTTSSAGYCDNFQNLYYGKKTDGKQLRLITGELANAFAAPTQGADTVDGGSELEPFLGYMFYEDPVIVENDGWGSNYGLVAYPVFPGLTGSDMFWIDREGVVKKRPAFGHALGSLTVDESPLGGGAGEWVDVE